MNPIRLRQFRAALASIVLGVAIPSAKSNAATITVTGIGDTIAVDGVVTLREAVNSINAGANVNADVVAVGAYGTSDTINFGIPGAGVHTIQPITQFVVTKPVIINGYSQSGSSANSLPVGNNAILTIEIDGSNAGSVPGGILKLTGGISTVRGLVINRSLGNSGYGLELSGGGNNIVAGNFIGSDPTGTVAQGSGCQALHVEGLGGNTIGGTDPADRNLISRRAARRSVATISSSFRPTTSSSTTTSGRTPPARRGWGPMPASRSTAPTTRSSVERHRPRAT